MQATFETFWQQIVDSVRRSFSGLFAPEQPKPSQSASPEHQREQEEVSDEKSLKMRSRLYFYAARVTEVYDGDTITVDMDMGMGIWRRDVRIRLWRINTPELRGEERERGLQVRDFVRELLLDREVLLRTILDKRGQDKTGKFGRLLGEVLIEGTDDRIVNVNKLLLDRGLALAMNADGTMPVPAAASAPPPGVAAAPQPKVLIIACPYCGNEREVDSRTRIVEACSNCLDKSYRLE